MVTKEVGIEQLHGIAIQEAKDTDPDRADCGATPLP